MLNACFIVLAAHREIELDSSTMLLIFLFFALLALPVVILITSIVRRKIRAKKAIEMDEQRNRYYDKWYREWLAQIQQSGSIQTVPCDLLLKQDERCIYVANDVTLYEARAIRCSAHAFGSVPLGKTGIHLGQGVSSCYSRDEWTPISTGNLYLTNKQIYFDGDMQDRKIPLGKIATIKADYSAVEISSDTRQKSMVFENCNGQLVRDAVRFLLQS